MRFHDSVNNEENPLGINPDYFVHHHTGSSAPDQNQSDYLNREDYISAHFGIDRNGKIIKLMDLDRIAYHCGESKWDGKGNENIKVFNPKTGVPFWLTGMNPFCHGVEVYSDGYDFTDAQRKYCIQLDTWWCFKYDKGVDRLIRHEDIAPGRKWDIGKNFFEPFGSWNGYQKEVQKRLDSVRRYFDDISNYEQITYIKK